MAKQKDPIQQAYNEAMLALNNGNTDKVEELLSLGVISLTEPKFGGKDALTHLIETIYCMSDDGERMSKVDATFLYLLGKIEDVNIDTKNKIILTAIKYELLNTLDLIFQKGVNMEKLQSINPLMVAVKLYTDINDEYDRDKVIGFLLDKGVDPLLTPGILHYVGAFGSHELFMRIVDQYKYPLDLLYGEDKFPFEDTTSAYLAVKKKYDEGYQRELDFVMECLNNKRKKAQHEYYQKRLEKVKSLQENYEYLATHQPELNHQQKSTDLSTINALNIQLIEMLEIEDKENEIWKKGVRDLIKEGADVNVRDKNGMTLLHHIASFSYIPKLLIENNVNVNIVDNYGNTPLYYINSSNLGVIKEMLDIGLDTSTENKDKQNIFSYFINKDLPDKGTLILGLLNAGIAPMSLGDETLLHWAARLDDALDAIEISKLCIKRGLDVNVLDGEGRSALLVHMMQPEDKRSFIGRFTNYLLEYGSNIDLQDNDGNTAIHLSVSPPLDYMILLAGNPDLSLKNNKGISVFEVLKEAGYYDKNETGDNESKKIIDKLLEGAANKAQDEESLLTWKSIDAIKENPKAIFPLKLQGTIKLSHEAQSLYYIGGNTIFARGGFPCKLSCIDVNVGKVSWIMDSDTFSYKIMNDNILYFGKRVRGKSSYVAVDLKTGKEIWKSGFGNTYDAWKGSGAYDLGDKLVFSTTTSLIALDKKKGKKIYRIKLNDYNVSVDATVKDNEFIIQGTKKRSMAFYHYDLNTGELLKTTMVPKGMSEEDQGTKKYLLLENVCWYITEKCELCSLNLSTGEFAEYTMKVPAKFTNYEYILDIVGGSLHIKIRSHSGSIYKTEFDLNQSTLSKGDIYGFEEWVTVNSNRISWDDRKLTVDDEIIEMPDYRGNCNILKAKELYKNVLIVLQEKGLNFGSEKCALIHEVF